MVDREQFEDMLHRGVVEFSFTKKDGTHRPAMGTLHRKYLPAPPADPDELAKVKAKAEEFKANNPGSVKYWDIEADGFRTVTLEALVEEPRLVETL